MQHFIRVTQIARAQPEPGEEPIPLDGPVLVCAEDITMVEPLYDIQPHPLMLPDQKWQVEATGTILMIGEGVRVILSDDFEDVVGKLHAALTGQFFGVEGEQVRRTATGGIVKPHGTKLGGLLGEAAGIRSQADAERIGRGLVEQLHPGLLDEDESVVPANEAAEIRDGGDNDEAKKSQKWLSDNVPPLPGEADLAGVAEVLTERGVSIEAVTEEGAADSDKYPDDAHVPGTCPSCGRQPTEDPSEDCLIPIHHKEAKLNEAIRAHKIYGLVVSGPPSVREERAKVIAEALDTDVARVLRVAESDRS